ncbi:hypothetical protein VDGL01_02796 [Verticillium dahliae]
MCGISTNNEVGLDPWFDACVDERLRCKCNKRLDEQGWAFVASGRGNVGWVDEWMSRSPLKGTSNVTTHKDQPNDVCFHLATPSSAPSVSTKPRQKPTIPPNLCPFFRLRYARHPERSTSRSWAAREYTVMRENDRPSLLLRSQHPASLQAPYGTASHPLKNARGPKWITSLPTILPSVAPSPVRRCERTD